MNRKIGVILIIAIVVTLAIEQEARAAWLGTWAKRVKLSIDNGDINAPLSDFPILVRLSSSSGINNEDVTAVFTEVGANDKKIAVTKSDGTTQCYVEIEKWNYVASPITSSEAWLWVKVSGTDSVSDSADTELYLYYDGSQSDNTTYVGDIASTAAQNVWSSDYRSVYHLNHDAADENALDSLGAFDAEEYFAPDGNMDVAGIAGKGDYFDGDDYLGDNPHWGVGGAHTYSVWVKFSTLHDGTILEDGKLTYGHALVILASGKIAYREEYNRANNYLDSISSYDDGSWHYVCGGHTGSVQFLYIDGELDQQQTQGDGNVDVSGARIGNTNGENPGFGDKKSHPLQATLDELRVSAINRSAAWIKASYESERDDLLNFGSEEITISVVLRNANDTDYYTTWAVGSKDVNNVTIMDTANCVLVKNDSTGAEDFSVSTTGTNWAFASAAGENQCVLMGLFNGNSAPPEGNFSTTYDLIDGTTRWATQSAGNGLYEGASDGDNVAASSGEKLYIYLKTPSSVTQGDEETITVTIGCRGH
ncbi:MAG: hypothetical protein HQ547_01100 [Candidatus Omnitrophica bacterium]|nr:hypothetical protein [Candidatus Omnitrophota bacterium]